MNKAKFNLKQLNILMAKELSCINKIEHSFTILLHPMFSGKIEDGIKLELDSLINKYSNEFNGILLGYEAVKIVSNLGMVFDTFPFIHVDIIAKLFIFHPTINDIVEGIVVKKSPNHIGCLVHDLFNVSCVIPVNMQKEEWLGNGVQEGDNLNIQIFEIDMKSVVPYLKGQIESVSSSNTLITGKYCKEMNDSCDMSFTKQNKNENSKQIKEEDAEEYQFSSYEEVENPIIKTKLKKSKIKKEIQDDAINFEGNLNENCISFDDKTGICENKFTAHSEVINNPIPVKKKRANKNKSDASVKVKIENFSESYDSSICESDTGSTDVNSSLNKQKKRKQICNGDNLYARKNNMFQNSFSLDKPICDQDEDSFAFSTKIKSQKMKKEKN